MKKIILAITFCTAFIFPAAFAGDDSMNAHIANTLFVLFKITNMQCAVNANDYQQATFVYNGVQVITFKSKSTNWMGFFKKLSASYLPENSVSQINSKYKGCTIENVVMYFNDDAEILYYAEINLNNNNIILKISESGDVKEFDCTKILSSAKH